jgi:hypothetical protein
MLVRLIAEDLPLIVIIQILPNGSWEWVFTGGGKGSLEWNFLPGDKPSKGFNPTHDQKLRLDCIHDGTCTIFGMKAKLNEDVFDWAFGREKIIKEEVNVTAS